MKPLRQDGKVVTVYRYDPINNELPNNPVENQEAEEQWQQQCKNLMGARRALQEARQKIELSLKTAQQAVRESRKIRETRK